MTCDVVHDVRNEDDVFFDVTCVVVHCVTVAHSEPYNVGNDVIVTRLVMRSVILIYDPPEPAISASRLITSSRK